MAPKAIAQVPVTLYIDDNRTRCESPIYMQAEAEPIQPQVLCQGPFYGLSLTPLTPISSYHFDYTNTSAPGPVRWIAVTFWAADPASSNCNFSMGGNQGQVGPCPQTQHSIMNISCQDYCNGIHSPVTLTATYPCQGCIHIIITD